MKNHTRGTKAKSTREAPRPRRTRRSNDEITADTRRRLISAARRLFAAKGYAETSADEIGEKAGLTRGALHYQFGDKRGLFEAVIDQLLRELVARLARDTMEGDPEGVAELERGATLLLAAYAEPEIQRLLLREAPQVLGWSGWLTVQERSGLAALLDHALAHWVEAGWLDRRVAEPTRRLLFGALLHAGIGIADAGDRGAALALYRGQLARILQGLAPPRGAKGRPRR